MALFLWEHAQAHRFPAESVFQKLACVLTFMHMTAMLERLICKEIENTQESGLGWKQTGIQRVKVGKMLYFLLAEIWAYIHVQLMFKVIWVIFLNSLPDIVLCTIELDFCMVLKCLKNFWQYCTISVYIALYFQLSLNFKYKTLVFNQMKKWSDTFYRADRHTELMYLLFLLFLSYCFAAAKMIKNDKSETAVAGIQCFFCSSLSFCKLS